MVAQGRYGDRVDESIQEAGFRCIPLDGKIPQARAKGWNKSAERYEIGDGINYGIPAGADDGIGNGLFFVDCDKLKEGDKEAFLDGLRIWNRILDEIVGEEMDTPQVVTGSGGLHVYFKWDERLPRQKTNTIKVIHHGTEKYAKIDTRSTGGYVVGPGSIHPGTGQEYRWREDFSLEEREVADMPEVLRQLISGTHFILWDGSMFVVMEEHRPAKKNPHSSLEAAAPTAAPELVERIVKGLSNLRADDRDTWRTVLWAIHSTLGEAGADIAIDFSKRCPGKFPGSAAVIDLMRQANGDIKIGSLWDMLKKDNRALFDELQAEQRQVKKESKQLKVDEEYYIMDLINMLTETTWRSDAALRQAFRENAPKVLFRTYGDSEWYLKKSKKDPFYPVKKGLTKEPIFYLEVDEDGPPRRKRTHFAALANDMMNDIPRYNGIAFMPSNPLEPRADTGRDMNIWPGFKAKLVEQLDMGKVQPILDHIMKVWASDNQQYYDYLMAWIHHIIMKPQEKIGVGVVLRSGEQQIGKGLIADNFLRQLVFGSEIGFYDKGLDFMTQRFNEHLMSKIFVVADELTSADGNYHGTFDAMKSMITCSQMSIEIKGGRKFQTDSFINMMLLTNNSFSVKVEKGDRRYFILDCDERYAGNTAYFNWMFDNYINQDCADHFLTYMSQYETSVNLRDIPVTQLKQDMIEQNLSSAERFIQKVKDLKGCEDEDEDCSAQLSSVEKRMSNFGMEPAGVVFEVYEEWCRSVGEKPTNMKNFGINVRNSVTVKKTKKCNVYCF
jgi:hypothetical protein